MTYDASAFTDPRDALAAWAQSIRSALDSSAYVGGRSTFEAVVLTDPLPLSTAQAGVYFGTPASGSAQLAEGSSKFVFKGRIESIHNRPSQHRWLPDPCRLDFSTNADKARKIITLHTTFISTDDHATNSHIKLPKAGDKVMVELLMIPGTNPPQYDSTFGYYKGITSDTSMDGTQIANATTCQRISALFGGAMGSFGGYISGSSPAPPASDSGQVPCRGVLTSPYGWRVHPKTGQWSFHPGIDIAGNNKAEVYPPKEGEVTSTGYNNGAGNYVQVKHTDGSKTRYLHLHSINVKKGDKVTTATVLGLVGTTGMSTGPHLHYEFYPPGGGRAVDPMVYFGWQPHIKWTKSAMASAGRAHAKYGAKWNVR
jgi:hypothetical protein